MNFVQITENEVYRQLENCREKRENFEQVVVECLNIIKRCEEDEERLNSTLILLQKQKKLEGSTWTDLSSLILLEQDDN